MKKTISILTLTVVTVLFSFKNNPTETKYKVENTLQYWQSRLNLIEYTKNAIKSSDLPAKVALPLTDSLSQFENEMIAQIQLQMPKDTTKHK